MLAEALNLKFLDMDSAIEFTTGKSIATLFNELGEEGFRQIERDVLHDLSKHEHCLISTGGGAPCFFDNMDFMKAAGETVYLKGSATVLIQNLHGAVDGRPLLKGKTEAEMEAFINQMLEKREPFYLKADHVLDIEGITADNLLSRFLSLKES